MADQEVLEYLAEIKNSTRKFSEDFLSHYWTRPFTKLHDEIFRVLDDDNIKRALILAPRGIGKTSIATLAFPLKKMLFRDSRYIISLGASADTAMEQTENLKAEIRNNEKIKEVFGNLSKAQMSKEEWHLSFHDDPIGSKILPRGAGQKVRGRRHQQYRPDLVIVDDLEDDKSAKSDMQRNDIKSWFFASLSNITDVYGSDWRMVVIGTILHQDSLLANLRELPEWTTIDLRICDENFKSNIPEWKSDQEILDMYNVMLSAGQQDKFYMEFMNTVTAGKDGVFQTSMFRYYEEDELRKRVFNLIGGYKPGEIVTIIMCDPAKTTTISSCESAIMAISVDIKEDKIYIRDIDHGRYAPADIIDRMLDMADDWNASLLAPEVTGLNDFFIYPLNEAQLQRYGGMRYDIFEVKPIRSKEDRARGLTSWFRRGAVYFNKSTCRSLESALLAFPRCAGWDILDCLSNLLLVLSEHESFVGMGEDDWSALETPENEYATLNACMTMPEYDTEQEQLWMRI